MSPVIIFFFSSKGDKENVLTLWKMGPHQARMGFAQAVDNSLIPGKLLLYVQHILYESFINIILSMLYFKIKWGLSSELNCMELNKRRKRTILKLSNKWDFKPRLSL